MNPTPHQLWAAVEKLRASCPLVLNLTNYVVMNNTANALLALGASPVMAHAAAEQAEFAAFAGAVVLNIGTLDEAWIPRFHTAAAAARAAGKPIVLDPVGAGASKLRTETAYALMRDGVAVLRGNASEVMALNNAGGAGRGVDSLQSGADALDSARALAKRHGCVVSVSGETDYIVSPEGGLCRIRNGHAMMPRVTGLGCTASAVTGAFCAVADPFTAAVAAMAVMGVAGEIAAASSPGPGTLQLRFLDTLYALDEAAFKSTLRLDA